MRNPATARYRRILRWGASAAVLGALALLLSACSPTPQTTFTPHSDVGQRTQDVFMLTVWIAVAIGVLIEGALIVTIVRFRRRRGEPVSGATAARPLRYCGRRYLRWCWFSWAFSWCR